MTIKHLVLSGGAYLGLYQLGAMSHLAKQGFYIHSNLESIYGTSIGGLLGSIICLNNDWDTVIDYFEKRPWEKLIQITPAMLFDVIPNKGLLGEKLISDLMTPLIKAQNLEETITLKELYDYCHVDLYLYTICVNTFSSVKLSHKSHPDISLIKALYMSCALPYLFQPVWYKNEYYIDGGLLNNYPILDCIDDHSNINEVLSSRFVSSPCLEAVTQETNLFEYGYFLYRKLVRKVRHIEIPPLCNEIIIPCVEINVTDGKAVLYNTEERKKYIEQGIDIAKLFLLEKGKNNT